MSGRLQDKVCVITGAGGGMGAEAAHVFTDEGARVVVADVDGDAAAKVAGEVGGLAVQVDVSDEASVQTLYAAAAERFGGIDVVVPNAGVGAYGPFLDLSREHLDEMLDVNLKGTVYAIRAALPHMLGREGDIVTLASEAGRRGLPYEAGYARFRRLYPALRPLEET